MSSQEASENTYNIRKSKIWHVILSGISWFFGYAIMWISKWIIGGIILNKNILEEGFNQVFLRSGAAEHTTFTDRFHACYINWKHYEYKIYMIILIAWLLLWIIKSICYGLKTNKFTCASLLTGFSSIVWYFVLSNHTSGHHLFTYRIYGISILAFLAILAETVSMQGVNFKNLLRNPKILFLRTAIWGLIAILAFGISATVKEPLTALNGYCDFTNQKIQENEKLEMDFKPTFSEICSFAFGMKSNSTSGTYELSLFYEDTEIYHLSVPITDLAESSYSISDVDWHLKKNETYHICIEPIGNNAPVYAEITKPGQTPLIELDSTSVGNAKFNGQMIMGITYNAPTPFATRLFHIFTWMGILAVFLAAGKEIKKSYFYPKSCSFLD